ncbi:hypothetical protein E5Q_00567 [Mixia osmundae IAM 14324]|uniref:Anaphase-promoting complex subunit 10 n=1 Tax=Mixia osmundae (strain CBS 9802 / IAM 14324 / JCM 22182 / KY 12970) TaxID=764103 RepID=G7DT42_MIXOS|nr:hypothetical protein E5Q_00567 [Mixia osmundae IAM 14324]
MDDDGQVMTLEISVRPSSDVSDPRSVDDLRHKRDVGRFAQWSVSSAKPGYGVQQLLDPSVETLWQSEGPQPHLINIQFRRRMPITQVSLFVDVNTDDSYTPHRIAIRAGSFSGDLQEIKVVELERPRGWSHLIMGEEDDEEDQDSADADPERGVIRAHYIQLAILANHLNGKDTHVRHIKIFAPRGPDST